MSREMDEILTAFSARVASDFLNTTGKKLDFFETKTAILARLMERMPKISYKGDVSYCQDVEEMLKEEFGEK